MAMHTPGVAGRILGLLYQWLREPLPGASTSQFDRVSFALWFGILAGLIELGERLIRLRWVGTINYAILRVNHHFYWMVPLSNVLVFGMVGAGLALLSLRGPDRRLSRLCVGLCLFLTAFSMALRLQGLYHFTMVSIAVAMTWVLCPLCWRHGAVLHAFVRRTLPIGLVGLLILVVIGFRLERSRESRTLSGLPAASPGSPNVLLIVLDTVRADALTPYGSARDTTPGLANWTRRGARFDNAHSTAPWTLPAHASLFTGRWVHEHDANVAEPLDATYPTLAEVLSDRGYATAGFVANLENCNAWYGLDRGFARYEDYYENDRVDVVEILRASTLGQYVLTSRLGQSLSRLVAAPGKYFYRKTAAMINHDALAWLSGHKDRPFFLFLNYYDAHSPYAPPEGEEREFSEAVSAADRTRMELARACYEDCLAYLDTQVDQLLQELERQGVLQNTIVVVTSDHGEAFGEHGLYGHGVSLYRPELHIPLLVIAPSRVPGGVDVDEPVSLRDIPATIVEMLGPGAGTPLPGTSLRPLWANKVMEQPRTMQPVLSEVDRSNRIPPGADHVPAARGLMRSLLSDDWMYIRNGDDAEELYNLESDPDQHQNLVDAAHAQDRLVQLREQLAEMTSSDDDASD